MYSLIINKLAIGFMPNLKKYCHTLTRYFKQSMTQSLLYSEHQLVAIGIIGFLGFPLFYFLWKVIFPQPYESLFIRLSASILCIGLMLKDIWLREYIKYMPAYWFFTLFYIFPFSFSFLLFKNHDSLVSALGMLMGTFLLSLLVDWISFIFLLSSGIVAGWLLYYLTTPNPSFPMSVFAYIPIYIFTIVAGFIFNHKKSFSHLYRLEGMAQLSSNVAHELRTPLLGLKSGVIGLKRYLPSLTDTYEIAKKANLEIPKIRLLHFHNLLPALERMESEITFANIIIDMLIMNVGKQVVDPSTFMPCSIVKCVNLALERYPFDSAEQEAKIHWQPKNDFIFIGSQLLMEHVLLNLIKNALHFIVKAEKGEIYIWLEPGKNKHWNELHFKDTGQGITREVLPYIFDRFFTTTLTGTGIGLSFCKTIMHSFKGEITCHSVEGEFSEFILSFPAPDKSNIHKTR